MAPAASTHAWPIRCLTLLQFPLVSPLSTLVGCWDRSLWLRGLWPACTGGTSSVSKRGNPISGHTAMMPWRLLRLPQALLPHSAQHGHPMFPPFPSPPLLGAGRAPPPPVLLQHCAWHQDLLCPQGSLPGGLVWGHPAPGSGGPSSKRAGGHLWASLWQVLLGVPGEGQGRRLIEVSHEEDADSAAHKEGGHDEEADTVDHPSHQDPLFTLLPVA